MSIKEHDHDVLVRHYVLVAEILLHDVSGRGLISIKAQTVDYEIPMNPITMMRNALGK
jgi:hypothetical protein